MSFPCPEQGPSDVGFEEWQARPPPGKGSLPLTLFLKREPDVTARPVGGERIAHGRQFRIGLSPVLPSTLDTSTTAAIDKLTD